MKKVRSILMASSKLSDRRIRSIIRCYVNRKLALEAARECGVSYVTAHQIYGYIRRRMCEIGLYPSYEEFIRFALEGEEEGPYFDWSGFEAYLEAGLGKHRGISAGNRADYLAEQIFYYENRFTPGQHYQLVMLTIEMAGPLNRPVREFDADCYLQELIRIELSKVADRPNKHRLTKDQATRYRAMTSLLDVWMDKTEDLLRSAFMKSNPRKGNRR